MAITETFAQVAPDSTGKKIDNTEVTNHNSDVVLRQAAVISDPEDVDGRAAVVNSAPAANTMALATRQVGVIVVSGVVMTI